MRRMTLVATAAAVLAAPSAAEAHVTVQPQQVPAGSFTRLDVRVPNERDDAGTVKVQVQMPDGIASASYEAVPGWTVKVAKEKAPEPIDLHGEQVTEQIDSVTLTGDGKQGIVKPGEFRDFGLSVRTPDGEPGDTITFKALQTYEGGEVVRWIGPEDSEDPAPTVTLAASPDHAVSSSATGAQEPAATDASSAQEPASAGDEEIASAPALAADGGSGGGSDGLAIAALIVGALGLMTGIGALIAGRRARNETTRTANVATQP